MSDLELIAQLRNDDNVKLHELVESANSQLDEGEKKLENLLKDHLEEVKAMCLTLQERSGLSDTDIKLLGPRLKAVSDSFLKNSQENEMKIKAMEMQFVNATSDMRRLMEADLRAERQKNEARCDALKKQVQEERLRGEQKVAKIMEENEKTVMDLQKKIEHQVKISNERMKQKEMEFNVKQNTILNALKNSASKEEEKSRAAVLELQAKAARDEIERMREVSDMEHKAELAASKKFESMVAKLKKEWAADEAERVRIVEERVRVECSTEITQLRNEMAMNKKLVQETQAKWMDVVTKQNYEHHDSLDVFAQKCRKNYDEKIAAMTERVAQQFNTYERQLLDSDRDMTEQAMQFENKLHSMKVASNEWRDEYQRQIDAKHLEAVSALENKYMFEIEKLLEQVATLQNTAQETSAVTPDSSRARMDGLLSNFIKLKKALELDSNEQIALLMKLLQSADFSVKLLKTYGRLEDKLRDQLPIKKMAARREFVKYRLGVISRFGSSALTAPGGAGAPELLAELRGMRRGILTAIEAYEAKHESKFLFEGRVYKEVMAEDSDAEFTEAAM